LRRAGNGVNVNGVTGLDDLDCLFSGYNFHYRLRRLSFIIFRD
jgi:hypothetical protein